MTELSLPPTSKIRRPELFEPTTELVRRHLMLGVASRRPHDVAVMIGRARARGVAYRRIATWLGPRASSPPELLALRERLELLASLED